ncbi:hypothetical protein PISMIDRAFT_13113 [Pisolithus microcarpus 441]|uniref:Uncharacterized protein n=1 Tax=Pisolithus microcarpus 441 TaxID=765257 RepID=A0A0C9Y6F8_9AGAM|nr:hypothetical protein PISMIDRAFT_13113 [Pisolithus microcarpus 441]
MPKRQYEDVQTIPGDLGLFWDDDHRNLSLNDHSDAPTSVPPSQSLSESEFQISETNGSWAGFSLRSLSRNPMSTVHSQKNVPDEIVNQLRSWLRQLRTTHQQETDKLQKQLQVIQQSAQLELEEQKLKVTTLEKIMHERETMYQRECDELRKQICVNCETAASLETKMNERETMYQQECTKLHEQIHINHETAASQRKNDMENFRKQFEVEMNDWVEKLTASSHLNLTRAMEQRDQELDEKVRKIKQSMEAAKESELANLEQKYARCRHQAATTSSTHLVPPPRSNAGGDEQPATQQSKAAPRHSTVTPNLDVIKRLKRSRGFSRRSHLVGVRVEEDEDIPDASTTERENPVPPSCDNGQLPSSQASTVIDAVTKGVEATLKNILANGQRDLEPSWQHDFCLNEVHKLFKDKFNFTNDTEFIGYESADPRDVHASEYEDGPGPDMNSPVFDLMHSPSSLWNGAIIDNILQDLQTRCRNENWPIHRSDTYLRTLVVDRYRRLRTVWRKAQPKLTEKGTLEMPAETETRLVAERETLLKANRQTTHRHNKYCRRTTVVKNLVKLKMEENEDDIDAWKWLKDLITSLGKHGMSSEESGVENEVEVVLHVKNLPWHRSIERELDLIDLQRLLDRDIFALQGARPLQRIRAPGNLASARPAIKGLPIALYDRSWIAELSQWQLEALHIADTPFPWMKIAVS